MDSTTYAAEVAANIQNQIKAAGLSVLSVAQATGIPYTTLTRRLASNGLAPFTVREVKVIADHLGTSASDLLTVYVTAEKVPA